jgi:surfactin synthase thioesterase subunit
MNYVVRRCHAVHFVARSMDHAWLLLTLDMGVTLYAFTNAVQPASPFRVGDFTSRNKRAAPVVLFHATRDNHVADERMSPHAPHERDMWNRSQPAVLSPRRFEPSPDHPRMRLICLPYAGGSAATYRGLQGQLPDIDVHAVELPGRGTRWNEPAHSDMDALLDYLQHALGRYLDQPFALLGHSMGAAIAYELACRLAGPRRANLRQLFLGACSAPGHARHRQRLQDLDDDAFALALRDLGGTPPEVLENADLMRLVTLTLRADFTLIENYRAVERCPMDTPITCFAGSEDLDIPVDSMPSGARLREDLSICTSSKAIISF